MNKQIGKITKKTIKILGLNYNEEVPIFIGENNIIHMQKEHPEDFEKYYIHIEEIVSNPTYLARNEKKKSIEFIKKYENSNEYVLIAVRETSKKVLFARTMYIMADEKVEKYTKHNYFYKF